MNSLRFDVRLSFLTKFLAHLAPNATTSHLLYGVLYTQNAICRPSKRVKLTVVYKHKHSTRFESNMSKASFLRGVLSVDMIQCIEKYIRPHCLIAMQRKSNETYTKLTVELKERIQYATTLVKPWAPPVEPWDFECINCISAFADLAIHYKTPDVI